MAISAEAFADAQQHELHNWEGHADDSSRLLYELVEHSQIAGPLISRIREDGREIERAVEVGVGCFGLGMLSPHLSSHIGSIDGVDPLPRLEINPPDDDLRAYVKAVQSRVNYIQAAGEELPLESDTTTWPRRSTSSTTRWTLRRSCRRFTG